MGNALSPVGGMGGAPAFEYYQDVLGADGTSGQIDSYQPPEDPGILEEFSDFLSRGLTRLAQGFAESFTASATSKGFGCSPSEYDGPPSVPPPPQPPTPDKAAEPKKHPIPTCEQAIEALRRGAFQPVMIRIHPKIFGLIVNIHGTNPDMYFGLMAAGSYDPYYPMDVGYTLAAGFDKNFETRFSCDNEDPESLYLPPESAISPALDKFISEHAKKFESLRGNSRYGSAEKAPKELDDLLKVLKSVVGLVPSQEEGGVNGDPRRIFKTVGIEFLEDVEGQKTYFLIYHHIQDFAEKNPPINFIVVDDAFAHADNKIRFQPIWVPNYNEDLRKYYVGTLEWAKPISQDNPDKTESKN